MPAVFDISYAFKNLGVNLIRCSFSFSFQFEILAAIAAKMIIYS